MIKLEDVKESLLKVPIKLTNPDSLTLRIIKDLDQKEKLTDKNICEPSFTYRVYPVVAVRPKYLARALRIVDTLIKNSKILDYEVELNENGLFIKYKDDDIRIYIKERCVASFKQTKYSWRDRTLTPSDKLVVKLERIWHYEYADTTYTVLEDKIETILKKIEVSFLKWEEQMTEARLHRENLEREEQKAMEIKIAKEDELNRFKEFYREAMHWKNFQMLTEYYAFLNEQNLKPEDEMNWLAQKLDWYNPFKDVPDEKLDDINKRNLFFE